ncbi:MAG: hypothetical protein CMD46_00865 [Gammaproteobacteria bacterium]|nr:hypothetical protein [Gammaproteobacteria bacterium]|tara:strand:- start:28908 stop:29315 length:408 start_codon:yes stop_codon:yes gene_type:complete
MIEVKDNGIVLARYIPASSAWENGLSFFSDDKDYIQVGTWGYDKPKELLAHTHNEVHRDVAWTQEVIFVKKGSIKAEIYDLSNKKVKDIICNVGDIIVLLRGAHGYHILEDDTQVLEVKNGPYVGAELDRVRIKK